MAKNVETVVNRNRVVHLLKEHPDGLDIDTITKELNADIKDVKPILIDMQQERKISSGLKKMTGKFTIFNRHYFIL
ncbi:MAG: hypothetical protein ABIJ10_05985 [Candidatus Micrarchaeota archaeon]